jgi:hypothetical protein
MISMLFLSSKRDHENFKAILGKKQEENKKAPGLRQGPGGRKK